MLSRHQFWAKHCVGVADTKMNNTVPALKEFMGAIDMKTDHLTS